MDRLASGLGSCLGKVIRDVHPCGAPMTGSPDQGEGDLGADREDFMDGVSEIDGGLL